MSMKDAVGSLDALQTTDPEVYAAIDAEEERQRNKLLLIASENFASPAVLAAQGSLRLGPGCGPHSQVRLTALCATRASVRSHTRWKDGWANVICAPSAPACQVLPRKIRIKAAAGKYSQPRRECSVCLIARILAYPLVRVNGVDIAGAASCCATEPSPGGRGQGEGEMRP